MNNTNGSFYYNQLIDFISPQCQPTDYSTYRNTINIYILLMCTNIRQQLCNIYRKWMPSDILRQQSNLYIKDTQGNLKMWPLWAATLYIQVTIICTIHYIDVVSILPFYKTVVSIGLIWILQYCYIMLISIRLI
jgi:hypothetical protein